MSDVLRYGFWIALFLIAVVYFTGSTGLGKVIFSGSNQLLQTATGQTSTGFKAYPKAG